MDLSVVVPVYNEEESLRELAGWIERTCNASRLDFEVIFIDDGSSDETWQVITELSRENSFVKGLRFRRNYGKAAALHSGFT
ncbi:MAG TPA: glycosyltransferase, partial [Bacteroidales bacterium]|nr:glycosyltransferase [Bacteroidales bacterium]